MKKRLIHPAWWLLYLSVALVLGLFWIEAKSSFSTTGRTWAEVGLVFILYGLVTAWLKANEAALISEEREKYKQKALPIAVDTSQTRRNDTAIREDNSHPHDVECRHKSRTLPV